MTSMDCLKNIKLEKVKENKSRPPAGTKKKKVLPEDDVEVDGIGDWCTLNKSNTVTNLTWNNSGNMGWASAQGVGKTVIRIPVRQRLSSLGKATDLSDHAMVGMVTVDEGTNLALLSIDNGLQGLWLGLREIIGRTGGGEVNIPTSTRKAFSNIFSHMADTLRELERQIQNNNKGIFFHGMGLLSPYGEEAYRYLDSLLDIKH